MKKYICCICGQKRGRRQCPKYDNKFICGDCCSNIQISSSCPRDCIHLGKLNTNDLNNRITELLDAGSYIQDKNPHEAIKLYDKVLELDKNNIRGLLGKSAAYSSLAEYDTALEYLKRVFEINNDLNVCINIASIYRKQNKYRQAIDVLKRLESGTRNWKADYLMGDCLFMSGQHQDSVSYLDNVIEDPLTTREYKNKARVILSRIHIEIKDYDRAMEYAESIDEEYKAERINLVENIYFAAGRMYELLNLLGSMEKIDFNEKYMLLQCALVLKKNTQGSIISIIDDLMSTGDFNDNPYGEASLAGLKIILLFKELRLKDAYEVFQQYRNRIINSMAYVQNCSDACYLIAFFLYSIDRKNSIEIYSSVSGMEVDEFLLGELYSAFSTLDIPPYIMAKSIEKSLQLVKKGREDIFNRTSIAADILYDCGEYSQAYEMYNRILEPEKPDMVLMNKMATCLMRQSKYCEALELYRKIISFTKFIPSVYSGAIGCSIELDAEWSEYYKCLELEKLSFSELYELAYSLMSAQHFDKAGYLYNFILDKFACMDIYSKRMVYHNMAGVYRNLKEYGKGIEIINSISSKYMGENLLMDLGCLYYDSGQYMKAVEVFEKALELNESPLVYFNMGILSMKAKDYEAALGYFATSRERTMAENRSKRPKNPMEYGNMLKRLYKNTSLCLIKLGRLEEALSFIDMSGMVDMDDKISEITYMIQRYLVKSSRGEEIDTDDIENMCDSCLSVNEGFTEDIKRLLDDVIYKIYGKRDKSSRLCYRWEENIAAFLKNEKRIYKRYRDSIERSEGTFQRYVENLYESFGKKVLSQPNDMAAAGRDIAGQDNCGRLYSDSLVQAGDSLFDAFEFDKDEYIYSSLIPYFIGIKHLCRDILYPYYTKNVSSLPVPSEADEFKDIGIFSYKTAKGICYRMDFSFNISCSQYLFEINCHPGLRSRYLDSIRHYMPWDKLMWMISGISKKWDVLDDIRSSGLLLLFYCGFKNYLGIEGEYTSSEDYIRLAGDLIHVSNERDYYIRSMLEDRYEYDCVNAVREVKALALRCIESLNRIKRL